MNIIILIFLILGCLGVEAKDPEISEKPLQEITTEASQKLRIGNVTLDYQVIAGTLVLKDETDKDRGSVFYTAYFQKNVQENGDRPITFCFNGGPGAGSVWLNLGFLGPKCIEGIDRDFLAPPYHLVDNPDTLLDLTDLVFIDPIPAGYSSLALNQDIKQFAGVDEDVDAMCEVVRTLTTKYKRWNSRKYFVGESYGGMRVVKMGHKLHDTYGFYLNGLILISPALDMMILDFDAENDLPYFLYLPTFAATHWFYSKKEASFDEFVKKAEKFAYNPYSLSLLKGSQLKEEELVSLSKELSNFSGIPEERYKQLSLRVKPAKFRKEYLNAQNKILGWFDTRYKGNNIKNDTGYGEYDPSLEAIYGAMTSAYTQYLIQDLNWPQSKEYKVLTSNAGWNWGKGSKYASATYELKALLTLNPTLKVLTALGYYDLTIPYFGTEYNLTHLVNPSIDAKRLPVFKYQGGHMMYLDPLIRRKLKSDISQFFIN